MLSQELQEWMLMQRLKGSELAYTFDLEFKQVFEAFCNDVGPHGEPVVQYDDELTMVINYVDGTDLKIVIMAGKDSIKQFDNEIAFHNEKDFIVLKNVTLTGMAAITKAGSEYIKESDYWDDYVDPWSGTKVR